MASLELNKRTIDAASARTFEMFDNLTHIRVIRQAAFQFACNALAMHCNAFKKPCMTNGRFIATQRATHAQLMGRRRRAYTTNWSIIRKLRAMAR